MGKVSSLININAVVTGNIIGSVLELNDGSLIAAATDSGAWIKKSIDGGVNWVTKYTYPGGFFTSRTLFQDSRGYVYVSFTKASVNVPIIRSIDNGETWTIVATTECDGAWHMKEDSLGHLYLNEYSVDSALAIPPVRARNIWKSTDGGETWFKWYTNNRNIRHCHWVYVTTNDRIFTGFGDILFVRDNQRIFTEAGFSYELNLSGNEIREISGFGNGHTGMIEADNGDIFLQSDLTPNYIHKFNKDTNRVEEYLSIASEFGSQYDHVSEQGPVKGKHGVLYLSLHTKGGEPSYLVASYDDGLTWCLLEYVTHAQEPRFLSVNKNRENSRVYICFKGTGNYVSIPDYTKAQLKALFNSSVTINGIIS